MSEGYDFSCFTASSEGSSVVSQGDTALSEGPAICSNLLGMKRITFGVEGKWFIDDEGLLIMKDIKAKRIEAQEYAVSTSEEIKTVGEGIISYGQKSVTIQNPSVISAPSSVILSDSEESRGSEATRVASKIFVTFRGNPVYSWSVSYTHLTLPTKRIV